MQPVSQHIQNIFTNIETRQQKALKKLLRSRARCDIRVGIASLNSTVGGLPRNAITMISGPEYSGKTFLLAYMLKTSTLDHKCPSIIFSAALPSRRFAELLLGFCGEFKLERLIRGRYPERDVRYVLARLRRVSRAPVYMEDNGGAGISLELIEARLAEVSAKGTKLEFVFIDGFERMVGDNKIDILNALDAMAVKHNLTIIITCRTDRHTPQKYAPVDIDYSSFRFYRRGARICLRTILDKPELRGTVSRGNYDGFFRFPLVLKDELEQWVEEDSCETHS